MPDSLNTPNLFFRAFPSVLAMYRMFLARCKHLCFGLLVLFFVYEGLMWMSDNIALVGESKSGGKVSDFKSCIYRTLLKSGTPDDVFLKKKKKLFEGLKIALNF